MLLGFFLWKRLEIGERGGKSESEVHTWEAVLLVLLANQLGFLFLICRGHESYQCQPSPSLILTKECCLVQKIELDGH